LYTSKTKEFRAYANIESAIKNVFLWASLSYTKKHKRNKQTNTIVFVVSYIQKVNKYPVFISLWSKNYNHIKIEF